MGSAQTQTKLSSETIKNDICLDAELLLGCRIFNSQMDLWVLLKLRFTHWCLRYLQRGVALKTSFLRFRLRCTSESKDIFTWSRTNTVSTLCRVPKTILKTQPSLRTSQTKFKLNPWMKLKIRSRTDLNYLWHKWFKFIIPQSQIRVIIYDWLIPRKFIL